jgi:hypothetical protein
MEGRVSLFCPDNEPADFPRPGPPTPPERGAPWKPPDVVLCTRCSRAAWQHTSQPPAIADDLDRAIYAAAFVDAFRSVFDDQSIDKRAAMSVREAEFIVEAHRRARSGT